MRSRVHVPPVYSVFVVNLLIRRSIFTAQTAAAQHYGVVT